MLYKMAQTHLRRG